MNKNEGKFVVSAERSKFGKLKEEKIFSKEKIIKGFFAFSSAMALIFVALIFIFLFREGINAFLHINLSDFFVGNRDTISGGVQKVSEWYPTSETPRYSLIPLLLGSLVTSFPAIIIATLFGVAAGIYLSEIAGKRSKEILKPAIELFASIPTVVLGFIMLVIGADLVSGFFNPLNRLNGFVASLGLSLVIIPVISSLTEEALRSVPDELRQASYGLGATKWETITRVLLPAASGGVTAGIMLGFGRAMGETMIVLMASGNAGNITTNIFKSVRTMTATIAAEMGEVSQGSDHYYALFFIGCVLFLFTFIINLIAELILHKQSRKNREL